MISLVDDFDNFDEPSYAPGMTVPAEDIEFWKSIFSVSCRRRRRRRNRANRRASRVRGASAAKRSSSRRDAQLVPAGACARPVFAGARRS